MFSLKFVTFRNNFEYFSGLIKMVEMVEKVAQFLNKPIFSKNTLIRKLLPVTFVRKYSEVIFYVFFVTKAVFRCFRHISDIKLQMYLGLQSVPGLSGLS